MARVAGFGRLRCDKGVALVRGESVWLDRRRTKCARGRDTLWCLVKVLDMVSTPVEFIPVTKNSRPRLLRGTRMRPVVDRSRPWNPLFAPASRPEGPQTRHSQSSAGSACPEAPAASTACAAERVGARRRPPNDGEACRVGVADRAGVGRSGWGLMRVRRQAWKTGRDANASRRSVT